MRDSKKTLVTVVLFGLLVVLFSFIVIRSYENSTYSSENDRIVRKELAGTLDTLVTGASHAEYGVDPNKMDQSLGTSTYNLSGPWQSTYGTKMLLEEELARNPIKKVYLTISEDTFWVRETSDGVLGDAKILPRLGGLADRVRYMLNSMGVREYPKLYQDMVNRGFTYWTAAILGADTEGVDPSARGFYSKAKNSVRLTDEEAIFNKSRYKLNTSINPANWKNLDDIIRLCREHGAEVQVIVVPVSDAFIWTRNGWDLWYNHAKAFCAERGVELWDFNLYKDRYELFKDWYSYRNTTHLSEYGASKFTSLLVKIIKRVEAGKSISKLFYTSYEEMKEDSPYAAIYNAYDWENADPNMRPSGEDPAKEEPDNGEEPMDPTEEGPDEEALEEEEEINEEEPPEEVIQEEETEEPDE